MKTYVVEVRFARFRDDLHADDSESLLDIMGNHDIEAESEEAALDKFHSTVPIARLETFDIAVRESKPARRFYVTMTWDDWPEGGSYGTVVTAQDCSDAEFQCILEMAFSRENEDDSAAHYLEHYANDWHPVDCFDLDEFIATHSKKEVKQ
jgi:hypothetical protein